MAPYSGSMRTLHSPQRSAPRFWLRGSAGLCAAAAALFTGQAGAQASPAALTAWTAQAQQWVQQEMTQVPSGDATGFPLRPEIEVGELDSRLRLAPCQRVEPYLPLGTRLWGRSRIGLRCLQGATKWNVFLPVTVKVWGPAWVIRQPVVPGTTLTQEHAELAEVDWAESLTPVIARPEDWVGNDATRPLMPGQVLRQGMVRTPQVFAAGSQVRVRIQGRGFTLSATGEALNHGHVGQTARVRMPNRRVLSGTVADADTVDIGI